MAIGLPDAVSGTEAARCRRFIIERQYHSGKSV
jgi:hypothetical protein